MEVTLELVAYPQFAYNATSIFIRLKTDAETALHSGVLQSTFSDTINTDRDVRIAPSSVITEISLVYIAPRSPSPEPLTEPTAISAVGPVSLSISLLLENVTTPTLGDDASLALEVTVAYGLRLPASGTIRVFPYDAILTFLPYHKYMIRSKSRLNFTADVCFNLPAFLDSLCLHSFVCR